MRKSECLLSFVFLCLKKIKGYVSMYALKLLFEQYELTVVNGPLAECRGLFKSSMGLSRAHIIREKKNSVLELDDIRSQWRIDNRSFDISSENLDRNEDIFHTVIREFQDKYYFMTLSQKGKFLYNRSFRLQMLHFHELWSQRFILIKGDLYVQTKGRKIIQRSVTILHLRL
ncbi:hypothetical protein ACH5RR_010992 [Cinchona calisaya]|uniref:Uncharacterized protein n=1 Tax=Cinchona calisaya TaxID=153742 RepID=A0ABD3A3M5_9GENT